MQTQAVNSSRKTHANEGPRYSRDAVNERPVLKKKNKEKMQRSGQLDPWRSACLASHHKNQAGGLLKAAGAGVLSTFLPSVHRTWSGVLDGEDWSIGLLDDQ